MIYSNHPVMGWDIFHSTSLLKAPSNLVLNTSRDGASTSLGNLFHCLSTLSLKIFFQRSNLNLFCFNLKSLPLLLLLHVLVKSFTLSFLKASFKYWKAAIRSFRSLFFSKLNNVSSQSLFKGRGTPALGSFSWPSLGPALTGPDLSWDPKAICSTPGGVL